MSQPSEPTPPEWAVKQASSALRGGMSAPEVEQRLVAVGLDPAVAKTVVLRAGSAPSGPPPMLDWAMEHARAGLRAGLRVPDIERQLVGRGLTPEIAEAVVTNVLGERVRGGQPGTPEQERRRTWHRVASGVAALLCGVLGYWFGGGYSVGIVLLWILTPVSFIWFADAPFFAARFSRSGPASPTGIRWAGWFLLIIYLLYRVELVLYKP